MGLKAAKVAALSFARHAGIDRAILRSAWRRHRLPILCFHGVSTEDEHECFPGFFIPQEMFRRKLALIRELDVTVLPLEEAIDRLASGTLPRRSAVLTIDDGFYAAYAKGAGLLAEFGCPATVYMTTHYVRHSRPVFDNMCVYLLWKASGSELRWNAIFPQPTILDCAGRNYAERVIREHALREQLSSHEKDRLLAELASRLGIDYDALCRRRLFHLINADEMRSWTGVRFELHTHRHRVSRDRARFRELVLRNAAELRHITGYESQHFAYPGGVYLPEHVDWLRELGIKSATTCVAGLATAKSSRWMLPRAMDTAHLSIQELGSWLTGVAGLLPVRSYPLDTSQFEGEPSAN